MSRTDKSEHSSDSCEKTVGLCGLLFTHKLTLRVIYLHTKYFLPTANVVGFSVENVVRHGQTKCQPVVEGDVSQSPISLKVKWFTQNALWGNMYNGWIVYLETIEFFH